MNTIDKGWGQVLIRLKSMVEELGADPEVFCTRFIELIRDAKTKYPDSKEKAIEMVGIAMYEEFGR